MNKKERKKGGDFFRTPTSELEIKLGEYEQLLKIAGEIEDFEVIASASEVCGDIIFVLNQRHMGRYIFPKTIQALDEFHEMKLNGKLFEAVESLNELKKIRQSEIEMIEMILRVVEKHI